jgi:hypothetical protein
MLDGAFYTTKGIRDLNGDRKFLLRFELGTFRTAVWIVITKSIFKPVAPLFTKLKLNLLILSHTKCEVKAEATSENIGAHNIVSSYISRALQTSIHENSTTCSNQKR